MGEPRIRAAAAADVSVIRQIVEQAYRHYIPRIGKPPGPMSDDYAVRVSEGVVWVIEKGAAVAGVIVLLPRPDCLLLDRRTLCDGRSISPNLRLSGESARPSRAALAQSAHPSEEELDPHLLQGHITRGAQRRDRREEPQRCRFVEKMDR